jgi:hypothetical protein
MSSKTPLIVLFCAIFVSLLACTSWAALHQPVQDWGGLTRGPDRYWTSATMLDAYFGFLTFYVWVFYKEPRWLPRIGWFVAIMLLGNMAMSAYVLLQLARFDPRAGFGTLLSRRNA